MFIRPIDSASAVATWVSQLVSLDSQAPTLLIRSQVRVCSAERAVRTVSNVVQQAQRIPRGLIQSVGIRIAQVQVRCRAVILIGADHICVLVEALTAIGHNAAYP